MSAAAEKTRRADRRAGITSLRFTRPSAVRSRL